MPTMTKWILALLLTLTMASAATAQDSHDSSAKKSSSESSSSSGDFDQDDARDAMRQGRIMPLTTILEIVAKREPGMVIEVDLKTRRGRLIYEIEVLADIGRRRELRLDARSGEILSVKDD